MLNVQEIEVLLAFLERVPTTGYKEARNLSGLAGKFEQLRAAQVNAELSKQFAPKVEPTPKVVKKVAKKKNGKK